MIKEEKDREESRGTEGARRATGVAREGAEFNGVGADPDSARGRKGRWSVRRKVTVVLELLSGAELEATSRKYGVTAATLTSWRVAFELLSKVVFRRLNQAAA